MLPLLLWWSCPHNAPVLPLQLVMVPAALVVVVVLLPLPLWWWCWFPRCHCHYGGGGWLGWGGAPSSHAARLLPVIVIASWWGRF